jgi:hypothetical protein
MGSAAAHSVMGYARHFGIAGRFAFPQSPRYQALCEYIREDQSVLRLAAQCRSTGPICFVFFAALNYLGLLEAGGYPVGPAPSRKKWYRMDRERWLDHRADIAPLLYSCEAQTNEVGRSALFALGAAIGAKYLDVSEVHLVDLGTSAGLNLFWDRVEVVLQRPGVASAPGLQRPAVDNGLLRLGCLVDATADLPSRLRHHLPRVLDRTGIDLCPVDCANAEAMAWLRALIWRDQAVRLRRFDVAVEQSQSLPWQRVQGEATSLLAAVCDGLSTGAPVVITHSYLFDKLTQVEKRRLHQEFVTASGCRPIIEIGVEFGRAGSMWLVGIWGVGDQRTAKREIVAAGTCHPHGNSLQLRVVTPRWRRLLFGAR